MRKLTVEWVEKAEDDFRSAQHLRQSKTGLHDQVCFHCQQSAEKYLKAVVQEDGKTVFRTHNLETVLASLLPQHPFLRGLRRGLKTLSRYAVELRYPGKSATKRQAQAALRWAARVRDACRAILGIPFRGKKSR